MLTEAIVTSPTIKFGKIPINDQVNTESVLVPGEYQLQIHIIECKDIILPEYKSCNPIVTYDICGKYKGHTNMVKTTKSPIFDYYKYINIEVTEELLESTLAITFFLKDSSTIIKSNTIGSFQIDLQAIYSSNCHELYRSYFPFVNEKKDKFVGTLLASLILLGKNDKPKIHNRALEIKNEKKEIAVPKLYMDINDLIIQKHKNLVVELYTVDKIPVLYGKSNVKSLNLIIAVNYLHDQVVSTDPIIVESSLSKKYYDTLYSMTRFTLPFKEPSIHTDFSVSLWDRQGLFKDDRLLGSTNKLKFDKALGNSLSYFNLYGSLIPDNMCLDLAEKNIMNCHPSIASGYLGRVLLKYYIMDNENSDTKVVINKSFKSSFVEENEISFITNGDIISNNIYSTVDHKFLPTTKQYIMTVKAYMGQGLPMISKLFKSTVPKFAVKFSIFDYEIVTDEQIIQNDMIFWNNDKNSNNNSIIMTLSENIDYIPDLFVYLLRDSLPVCYYRLRITDLLNIATFEPKWYELYADKTLVEEAKEYFNSSLLLSISFKVFDNDKSQISKEVTIFEREPTVSPYRLIIDVFQCKNLRSMDNFGLSDPYITFKICGKNVKTTIKKKTNDPQYFETLLLENIEMPDNPFYFPFLFIECLDSDLIGNDNIGFLKYSLKDYALIDDYSSDSDIYCSPKWFNFSSKSYHPKQEEVEYSSIGSILLRVRLFKLPLKSNICAPPSIAPVLKVFRMEILIYGIRHLKSASSMVPIMKPYLVLTSNETKIATLEPVRLCSSKNPNYCARITFDMRLPRESILSPNIYLSVYDKRLGSFTDSHIGLASIDLKSYYPNNSHDNFGKFKTGNPYHVDYLSTNSNADVNLNDFQNANNLPSYLINRKFLSVSLEDTLGNTPFQIYNCYR